MHAAVATLTMLCWTLPPHQAAPGVTETHPPIEKWTFAFGEKTWGLKLKSISVPRGTSDTQLLVEFTKELTPDELKKLRDALGNDGQSKSLVTYYFDADNVVIHKKSTFRVMGELTGSKGEAFRLIQMCPQGGWRGVVRADIRPIVSAK